MPPSLTKWFLTELFWEVRAKEDLDTTWKPFIFSPSLTFIGELFDQMILLLINLKTVY